MPGHVSRNMILTRQHMPQHVPGNTILTRRHMPRYVLRHVIRYVPSIICGICEEVFAKVFFQGSKIYFVARKMTSLFSAPGIGSSFFNL